MDFCKQKAALPLQIVFSLPEGIATPVTIRQRSDCIDEHPVECAVHGSFVALSAI